MPFLLSRKNKSMEVKVRLSELANGRHPDAPSRQSVGKTEENSHLLFTCTCKTLAVSRPSERRHQIPLWRPLAHASLCVFPPAFSFQSSDLSARTLPAHSQSLGAQGTCPRHNHSVSPPDTVVGSAIGMELWSALSQPTLKNFVGIVEKQKSFGLRWLSW